MRLAFRCVVRNGIRRFQVADPSNDPARLRRDRRARTRGGRRGGRHRADVLDQRRAHARVLRRAGGRARRLRRDGPPLPQGSRRPADAGGRARAGAALRRGRRRAPDRAAQPLHDRARAVRLHGRAARRVRRPAHGGRAARARHVEPGGRDDASRPRRPRASRTRSTSTRSPRSSRRTSARSPTREGPAGRHSRRSSTRRTTTTSSRAGWCRRRSGCSRSCAGPSCSTRVLEEVGRVRAEMGYPIIVTPVSQLVATQAVRNVIDGERWSNVSDETVRYFLGHYGDPAAPVDPDVADARALAAARRGAAHASSRSISRARGRASARGSRTRSCCCG